jgi:hypothetical protein
MCLPGLAATGSWHHVLCASRAMMMAEHRDARNHTCIAVTTRPIAQCRYTCGTCTTAGKLTHESMGTHEPEGGEGKLHCAVAHLLHLCTCGLWPAAAQHADGPVQVLMCSWCGVWYGAGYTSSSTQVHLG